MGSSTSSNKGTVHRYCRADVLRILRITPRQLTQWQKAGLVAAADTYSFFDLIQLKKVRDLSSKKVRPGVIRESLQAMLKQVAGMENPLLEAGAFSTGTRIAFRHEGKAIDPIAGQFVMDFAPQQKVVLAQQVATIRVTETAAEYFARGVSLEEDPASYRDAIQAYMKALEMEPNHAAAHINLGTIF